VGWTRRNVAPYSALAKMVETSQDGIGSHAATASFVAIICIVLILWPVTDTSGAGFSVWKVRRAVMVKRPES